MQPQGNIGNSQGSANLDTYWIDISWTFTETPPTGLLLGFEAVAYIGSDATNTNNYIAPPQRVLPSDRRWPFPFSVPKGVAPPTPINSAVRTLYAAGPGPWAAAITSVSATPWSTQNNSADNLIPNGNSELGSQAQGIAAAILVNDAVNAAAGAWCRKLDCAALNITDLSSYIACTSKDYFYFEAAMKLSAAGAGIKLRLAFFDTNLSAVGSVVDSAEVTATSYAANPSNVSVSAAAPATAVYVKFQAFVSTTSAGKFGYLDELLARRVDGQTIQVKGSTTISNFSLTGAATTPTSGSFTVPPGVRRLRITMQAAGTGGNGGAPNTSGGGGGGGGASAIVYHDVTPGDGISFNLPEAGTGGNPSGSATDPSGFGGFLQLTVGAVTYNIPAGASAGTRSAGGPSPGQTTATVLGRSVNQVAGGATATVGGDAVEVNINLGQWLSTAGSGAGGGLLASSTGKNGGQGWQKFGRKAGGLGGSGNGSGGGGGTSFFGTGANGGLGGASATAGTSASNSDFGAGGGGGGCSSTTGFAGGNGGCSAVMFEWGPGI